MDLSIENVAELVRHAWIHFQGGNPRNREGLTVSSVENFGMNFHYVFESDRPDRSEYRYFLPNSTMKASVRNALEKEIAKQFTATVPKIIVNLIEMKRDGRATVNITSVIDASEGKRVFNFHVPIQIGV